MTYDEVRAEMDRSFGFKRFEAVVRMDQAVKKYRQSQVEINDAADELDTLELYAPLELASDPDKWDAWVQGRLCEAAEQHQEATS